MAYYVDFVEYIACSTSTREKITKIEAIITALEDSQLRGASNADTEEYSLDDGQTKIRKVFKDTESISNAIKALEARKQRLINQCVGYRYNLMDGNTKRF